MKRRLLVAAGLLVLVSIASYLAILILGGQFTRSYPAVGFTHNSGRKCTGTLVAPEFYVTAAHCAVDVPDGSFENHETNGAIASTCVVHVHYDKHPPYFDVAVCKLRSPTHIASETLGGSSAVNQEVTYLGYGPYQFLRRLLLVDYPTRGTGRIAASQSATLLMTGNGIDDGDSGGPVFQGNPGDKGLLIGVLSCHADPDHRPRAVNLTDAVNGDWVKACLADFGNCQKEPKDPQPAGDDLCTG